MTRIRRQRGKRHWMRKGKVWKRGTRFAKGNKFRMERLNDTVTEDDHDLQHPDTLQGKKVLYKSY